MASSRVHIAVCSQPHKCGSAAVHCWAHSLVQLIILAQFTLQRTLRPLPLPLPPIRHYNSSQPDLSFWLRTSACSSHSRVLAQFTLQRTSPPSSPSSSSSSLPMTWGRCPNRRLIRWGHCIRESNAAEGKACTGTCMVCVVLVCYARVLLVVVRSER
jgi:hypothetical protein